MRVTQRMMTDNAIKYMDENLQRLQYLQNQVASGKQFSQASDNPAGATAALSLRSSVEANTAYLDTANVAEDWMSATDAALSQLIDVGKRAINLGLSGVSDTQGENERKALGAEMQTLLEQAVEIGNTSHQDKYLFSGLQTNTQPFIINGSSLAAFAGGSGGIKLNIGPGQTVTENIEGQTLWGMLDAIRSLRDQLNNTGDPNQSQAISSAVGALKEQFETVKIQSTTNGARLRQVRLTGERLEKTQIELKNLLSKKEDVNMVEAISTLRNQETVYQSVLEVGQRAISALNLFDMLS